MIYRCRVVVTEEAIRWFWPKQSYDGFIRDAEVVGDNLVITWGAWTSSPNVSEIPLDELKEVIAKTLPNQVVACNLPGRDSIALVFRGLEQTEILKPRMIDKDVYDLGTLTSEGFLDA